MKNKILPYVLVLSIGAIAAFSTFIIWNSFHKDQWLIVISIVSIFFFFLGIIAGMLKVHKVWLGWLALHAATLISFIPGILQAIFSGYFNEGKPLLLFISALTFVPMLFSLPAIFLAQKYLAQKQESGEMSNWRINLRKAIVGIGNLLIPVFTGFFGMFGVMFTSFFAYQLNIQLSIQYLAYPIIFALLAALLAMIRNRWLTDSLLVCFAPVVSWCGVKLWKHPTELIWWDFNNNSFKMILTTAMLLVTAIVAGYLVNRWKKAASIQFR